jgi:t-SNARE complex subunit (syntaxin)
MMNKRRISNAAKAAADIPAVNGNIKTVIINVAVQNNHEFHKALKTHRARSTIRVITDRIIIVIIAIIYNTTYLIFAVVIFILKNV